MQTGLPSSTTKLLQVTSWKSRRPGISFFLLAFGLSDLVGWESLDSLCWTEANAALRIISSIFSFFTSEDSMSIFFLWIMSAELFIRQSEAPPPSLSPVSSKIREFSLIVSSSQELESDNESMESEVLLLHLTALDVSVLLRNCILSSFAQMVYFRCSSMTTSTRRPSSSCCRSQEKTQCGQRLVWTEAVDESLWTMLSKGLMAQMLMKGLLFTRKMDGWRLQVKRTLALQCREETLVTKKGTTGSTNL